MKRFLVVLFFFFVVNGLYGQFAEAKRCPTIEEIKNALEHYKIHANDNIQSEWMKISKVSKPIVFHMTDESGGWEAFMNTRVFLLVKTSGIVVRISLHDNYYDENDNLKMGFRFYSLGGSRQFHKTNGTPMEFEEAYQFYLNELKNDAGIEFGLHPDCNQQSSSSSSDYNPNSEDSGLWKVVIGAAALGAAIVAIRKRLKKSKKKKKEKDKYKYILQLGDESFTLVENEPQFLYIQAWKITEKGKFPTNASIRIQNSEKALSILPFSGIGRLKSKLLLKGKPSNEEFTIVINASIGNKSIQKTVRIKTGGENKIIIKTLPDNTRSLRPNINQTLTCYAQVVDANNKPLDDLTKKIKFDPSQSKWIDLSDPILDDGWIAINIGASDPDGDYDVTHPPTSVVLGISAEYKKDNKPLLLENNLEIQLLDCMLETDLENITFPISEEKSEVTCKAYIENCDGDIPWKFKAVYMKDFETPDSEPLTEVVIEEVSETKVNITLTGPIIEPKEGEKFLRKLFVISAQQKDEKALERHIYVMVSKEGLFIEKGVDENNEITVVAKGDFTRDLELSLSVYNKETDQIEPYAEGLKNLTLELISKNQILKNIDQVLQTDLLFENIFGTMKHASYKLDIPFMLPGTGEDIYELEYKISVHDLEVENIDAFQQIITLKVETYGIGRQFPEWKEAYDNCYHDIIYYVRDVQKRKEFRQLLKTKGKELDVYGLVALNKLIIRVASKAILAEGKEWREYAEFLDTVIYVLEYVEWAGDIAFQVLVATFTGGTGGIAASAIKQTFITGATMVIQGKSIDDFTAKLWKDIEIMLYSTAKGRIVNTQTIEKYYKGDKYKVWAMYAVITFALQYKRLGSIPEAAKATAYQLKDEILIRYLHGKVRQEQARLKLKESKEVAKEKAKGKKDYETSKKSPDTSGYTDASIRAIQKIATKLKVRIITRPTNKAARALLKSGQAVAKKMFVKNKTISELDTYLGASKKNVGMVGSFKPKLSRQQLRGLPKEVRRAVVKRYKQRAKEWIDQAEHIKEYIAKGKMYIKDGVVYDAKSKKPFTGDIDIYDIRGINGERISKARYKEVTDELIKSEVTNVEHGAHKDWQWWKGSAKDVDVNKGISDVINKGHRKGYTTSEGKFVEGEALVDFRPGVGVNTTGVFRK